ncbi:hypothetical protein, partial [Vibrio breoganii]
IYTFKKYLQLNLLYQSLIYLIKGHRVVYLTGPEYGKGIKLFIVRCLWFSLMAFYGKRSSLYIKNVDVYSNNCLLKCTLKYVQEIYFESYLQKKYFLKIYPHLEYKSRVSYVYYPKEIYESRGSIITGKSKKLRVGLVGQFDARRRDYRVLIQFIEDYPDLLNEIEFWQIGRVKNDNASLKMKKELSHVVQFKKEDYSTKELDEMIQASDVLISFNSVDCGYDKGKGTAAFGDAICLRKPLIVPEFLSAYKEFSDFSYYYKTADCIYKLLKERKFRNIEPSVFDRFNPDEIKKAWSNEYR